ncbi:MAG: glycosyltransferase family 2 protein [Pseudomonadota bacterium]
MDVIRSYRRRLERKRLRFRARRKQRELQPVADRTARIAPGDVLLASTIFNEADRLPYFLRYYRTLGVRHFLFVDNGSDDGSGDYLTRQADVSVWSAQASYKRARFGMDWINGLLSSYAHGHWVLTVDADEFFVYPFADSRPIDALTDWLEDSALRTFSAMLIDMYPQGPVDQAVCPAGTNPLEIAPWFDSGNYRISRNRKYNNLWIQGGPRERAFFHDQPKHAPSLNKIPLVRWDRRYAYVQSTHMLLPRGLNNTYDTRGGEKISGCLLHPKFLSDLPRKAEAEAVRAQHFAQGREYAAYADGLQEGLRLWTDWSERYANWRQLELLGLMSKGNWA